MAVLARESPTFQPAMRVISAITQSDPVAITTTFDHDYETGTVVRLEVPEAFGMRYLDGKSGEITVTSSTQFTMDIDSSTYDAFATPSTFPENKQYAQVVAIGENNAMLTAATRNVLPY